jgi:hypothetical protein
MQERIDLRLSPGNPKERALIDALIAKGDEYGAKGRFLKDRLLRGHRIILDEVERLLQEGDPMEALDRYSSSVDSTHYRVLKVFMTNRGSEARGVQPRLVEMSREVPAAVATIRERVAPELPLPTPASVSHAPQAASVDLDDRLQSGTVSSSEVAGGAPAEDEAIARDEADSNVAAPVVAVTPRKHDWSSFAGIAGVKRGN